jgi:outer membrane translocation and assembly module TamA
MLAQSLSRVATVPANETKNVRITLGSQRADEMRSDESRRAREKNAARVSTEPRLATARKVRYDVRRERRVSNHVVTIGNVGRLRTALDECAQQLEGPALMDRRKRQLDSKLVLDRRGQLDGGKRVHAEHDE